MTTENTPWEELPRDEALSRARKATHPGWQIWYTLCWDGTAHMIIWCGRRLADGAVIHAESAGSLLQRIAEADGSYRGRDGL